MRSVKRLIALVLSVLLLLICFSSCAAKGEPLLTLDGEELSVNIFSLYLSRMKGTLCSAASFGSSAKQDSFWDTWMDVSTKTTYNTHYTDMVLETAKSHIAALALFEERGLKLPTSYTDEIDAEMQRLLDTEANGSKTAFNAILKEFGVSYEILREAYIIEAKIAYLQEDLFGKNGSKIGANMIDEYYKDTYARFKQVFLYSYEYEYVTDRNGDVMYFASDGKVSYDTSATAKKNSNNEYVLDENGDRVYVYTDEKGNERIAYKKDGASRENVLDSNGEPVIRLYNDTEMAVLKEQRDEILAQAKNGDMLGFDVLIDKYNEDMGVEEYPNGYYITETTNYASPEVIDKIFEMSVGEIAWVQSDYGIHIIMRCELEDGAYAKEEYKDLFISNKTGTYVFMDELEGKLLTEYLAPYKERVSVDEELYATVDIKRAGINYYY